MSVDNPEHGNEDVAEQEIGEENSKIKINEDPIITSEILPMLNGLYFIMLTMVGMSFSISSSVHGRIPPAGTLYSQIFLMYVYCMACIVLIVLLVIIAKHSKKRETIATDGGSIPALIEEDVHGVSFYMRIGMIIFTTGIIILFLLILFEPAQALAVKCLDFKVNVKLAVVYGIQLVFTVLQSYVLFKHHRVIIHVHIPVMRFCLAHLAATNLVSWSFGIITEAMVLFERYSVSVFVNASIHVEQAHILKMVSSEASHSPIHGAPASTRSPPAAQAFPGGEIPEITPCLLFVATSINAAEYLAPCIIEYSLVAASIVFKLLWAVCKTEKIENSDENIAVEQEEENVSVSEVQNREIVTEQSSNVSSAPLNVSEQATRLGKCDKANVGLFFGIGLTAAFMVYLIVLFIYSSKFNKHPLIHVGIIGISLCITLATIPLTIYAVISMSIKGAKIVEKNAVLVLDRYLIIFTAVCIVIYDIFALTSCTAALNEAYSTINFMTFFLYLINLLSAILQGSFLNDGLTRRMPTEEAVRKKPARTVLTILMFINIIFWMNKSFRAKIDEVNKIHTNFYGYKAWCILSSFFQPLNIFFSFHASVLFAEIWHLAYQFSHENSESN